MKVLEMPPILLAFALFFAFATPANAEVYKCQNQSGKIIYSDAPCKSGTQTVTDIPVTMPDTGLTNSTQSSSALARQMDIAVKSAIANNDLHRAQALATTREHWDWIAAAKREANQTPTLGRTEADLSAERGDSEACQQAIRSYELEASSSFDETEALNAKKSIMHAACGIKEPLEVNNYPAPATAFYPPRGSRPYYRRGPSHSHRPGWNNHAPHDPLKAEPPAVSVIVGPKK
jgi:hypothetical protein